MNGNLALFMIALNVISFWLIPLKTESLSIKNPCETLDRETFNILNDCAEKNTAFLKGKVSQDSIQYFKDYCSESFNNSQRFHIAYFSFAKKNEANNFGAWSVEYAFDTSSRKAETNSDKVEKKRILNLLSWLEKNYQPASNFGFFYLMTEPYYGGCDLKEDVQKTLNTFLDFCPLLLSCNHPDLPWSKKGICIPDDYMLTDRFHSTMKNLLSNKDCALKTNPLTNSKKQLIPFTERKPHVYFRGALSGPKLPFSFENMQENPRHSILALIEKKPYLNIGITNFHEWMHKKDSPYLSYLLENFSPLKCAPVDFFEHAQHKYLLSCDGYGAAWSRVELIMATGSVLFLNAECEQYFYPLMENNKTHIFINKDFSNLDAEFQRLEDAPELGGKIGKQGQEFAQKFFTQKAIDSYLWLVLNKLENYINEESAQALFTDSESLESRNLINKALSDVETNINSFENFSIDACNEFEDFLITSDDIAQSCPIARINYKKETGFSIGYFTLSKKNEWHFDHRIQNALIPFLNSLDFQSDKEFSFFVPFFDQVDYPPEIRIFSKKVPILKSDKKKGTDNNLILFPDFFSIKKEFSKKVALICKENALRPFSSRLDTAGFRGAQSGGKYSMSSFGVIPRLDLVMLSYKHPDYIDARFVNRKASELEISESGCQYKKFMDKTFGDTPFVPFHEMTQYRYNISLDGWVSPWERPLLIMFTGSVPLFQTNYESYFSPYLVENVHYVLFKSDMSDILSKIDMLRANPEWALSITEEAQKFAHAILTPRFHKAFMSTLLTALAQKFNVKAYKK